MLGSPKIRRVFTNPEGFEREIDMSRGRYRNCIKIIIDNLKFMSLPPISSSIIDFSYTKD